MDIEALKQVELIRILKQADLAKCRFCIFDPSHYREDGTCKCDDPEHRKMIIKNWGYKKSHFKGIPLRKE